MAKGKKRASKSKRPASKTAGTSAALVALTEPTANEVLGEAGEGLGIPPPDKPHYKDKNDWIDQHVGRDPKLTPKAAVEAAKKDGFDFTSNQFSTRKHWLTNKKNGKKTAASNGRSKVSSQRVKRTKSASPRSDVEAQFKFLLKKIGIDRASEILQAYEDE